MKAFATASALRRLKMLGVGVGTGIWLRSGVAKPFPGFALALDFLKSRYRQGSTYRTAITELGGYSYTRTGVKFELNTSSALARFAANVPGIVPDVGYFSRGALTNKCTNHNANPNGALTNMNRSGDAAATLTEVDDTAQLQIADLIGTDRPCTNGKVFQLDNSAGTTTAFATVNGGTGNLNPHSVSAYVRGGTGACGLGGTARPTFPASSNYVRRTHLNATPAATTNNASISADPGQVVFFILNQLVEGPNPGPIIVTAGAAASVGSDNLSTAVAMPSGEFTIIVIGKGPPVDSIHKVAFCIEDGLATTADRIEFARGGGNGQRITVAVGGTAIFDNALAIGGVSGSPAQAAGAEYRVALVRDSANVLSAFYGGTLKKGTATYTTHGALKVARIGHRFATAGAFWDSTVERVLIIPRALSETEIASA